MLFDKKPKLVKNEEQLEELNLKKVKDDFLIDRIFRFTLLGVYVFVLLSISFLFIYELISNSIFRSAILAVIERNLISIVVTGLSILGIYKISKDR